MVNIILQSYNVIQFLKINYELKKKSSFKVFNNIVDKHKYHTTK